MASSITKWFENMKHKGVTTFSGKGHHMQKAAVVVRQGGESVVVGGLLGALSTKRSLDYSLKIGTGAPVNVPIDGAVGIAAMAASMVPALREYHTDLVNAGSAALAVASFRKTQSLMHAKAATHHGESEFDAISSGSWGAEDPLIAAARALG